jgi:hypothetical protein
MENDMTRHIHLGDLRRKMIVLEKDLTVALNIVEETIKTLTFEEEENINENLSGRKNS